MNQFLLRYLLIGPHAPWPAGVACVGDLPPEVQAELAFFTTGGRAAVAQAWRDGEAELRAEAGRLGIAPRWPAGKFYGEACAAAEVRR